jgi:hypothetical protein
MSESDAVYQNDKTIWDFIKDNPRAIGVPISDKQGLDLLNALRDVYLEIDLNSDNAKGMLTMLASVLIAAAQGDGQQVIEEVLVQEAMFKFDDNVKEILDEK